MIKTYIFDIDNTLCNTWPTLKSNKSYSLRFFSEAWRVSFVPSFKSMIIGVENRMKRGNSEVFFLSARHWSLWIFTYFYLIRHVGFFSPHRLILVPKATAKIKIFDNFLNSLDGLLIVIDDLSYNTENGETLFYLEVINYLKSKAGRIRYIGKNKIDLLIG
jgi:hypothetical protein|tara:strand:+ start:2027 stop:2509 length:483 start_codon:yes stop_codon:yes gene_type:complete